MTLEAWVNPSWTTSEWQDVIYKGPDDTYYLEGSSPQNSSPAVGGTFSGTPLHGTDALPPNTWSHLAATYDGADLVLYVNGVQVASRPQTGAISTSAGPLTLGGDPLYGQYWAGLIDEVRIHNRALDPDEIQEDMAAPEVCGIKGGSLQFAADKQEISWASSVVSGPFDIVKGDLGLLRTSGGDFAGASCLQNDVWTKSSTDPEAPAPDGAFYYVMRCDGGTWADQTEVADREVTLSGCP
jgi:hypothetical protein